MSEAETRNGHYPYQAPIDAYGNNGFRFADMSHRGALLCLPTGMQAWHEAGEGAPQLSWFAPVLALADSIEVLMIGMGSEPVFLDPAIREAFRAHGVVVEAISTGSAVRTYNILLAEKRAVAAALIAVERVR